VKYTITFIEKEEKFEMNGVLYQFIGQHLYDIAKQHNITTAASSESHLLCMLIAYGISIELVEEGGSKLIW
jgi:hypothetical protein